MLRIGLISDTHNLLRPEAVEFLVGCAYIVHAGDIMDSGVLEQLGLIAPVVAVRGNNDRGSWANRLRETELVQFEDVFLHVLHDVGQLDVEPRAAGVQVVVSGHSHKPSMEVRDGALFINPGSAGPRRFKLPISVGELVISGGSVTGRTVELTVQNGT